MQRTIQYIALFLIIAFLTIGCDDLDSISPIKDQVFIKLFGGTGSEEGNDFLQLSDGGIVIVGSTTSYSEADKDIFIVKTDLNGNKEWSRRYGDQFDNEARAVIMGSDSNSLIICGETYLENGKRDIYLIRTDLEGNLIDQGTYGTLDLDEFGVDVINAISDGYLVIGNNVNLGNDPDSAFIYLLEVDENLVQKPNRNRARIGDEANFNEGVSALVYDDLNYLCFGSTTKGGINAPDSSKNFYLFRILENGDQINSPQFFGTVRPEIGTSFTKVTGGYLLAGYQINGNNRSNPYIVKVNNSLGFLWERVIDIDYEGAQVSREPTSVIQTNDGGFLLLMKSNIPPYGTEIGLMKLNFSGEQVEWETAFGSSNNDESGTVNQLQNGHYLMCGSVGFGEQNNEQINKMGLFKTNPVGELKPLE